MKVELHPLFGEVPKNADNLEIVGPFQKRFEEHSRATVWPGSGVIRWADGRIESETIWVENNLKYCGDYQSFWRRLPRTMRGRYFNISLYWWSNYYHWHNDVLTRLHGVLPRLDPDVQIILPSVMTKWQKRSLELIGLPFDRCCQHDGRRPWKVETLLYASPVAMTGDHEIESLQWVRDVVWKNCLGGPPIREGWRKLYLTRNNTRSRNVANETELFPFLQKYGFEMVDCERLTIDEQVKLFSEAACVVGPHGAAFTNILWAPPGLKVFEVFEPASVRRCYWSMCRVLGHHHACGVGQPVLQQKQEANLHIPVMEFTHVVEELLNVN